jgi:predicted permease
MSAILHELRVALRTLLRAPEFTGVAVLTLAVGIGANTAIFSAVDGVLLRPAPVPGLERLAMVWQTDRDTGTTREPASIPDYLDFIARSRSFESLAGLIAGDTTVEPPGGQPQRVAGLTVSRSFLPMLGIEPVAGRTFTEEEDRPRGPRVALISESLWQRAFGSSPDAVGRTLRIDEEPAQIVGVVPDVADFGVLQVLTSAAYSRGFADRGGRTRVDVWVPLQPDPAALPRDTHPLIVLGRLAPARTIESAQDEMSAIAADLERTYPSNNARGAHVEALGEVVFGPVRPALYLLLGAVGLVLLITCVNVANLLLARGAARTREVAVRGALGAGTSRLARQFVLESVALTSIATLAGVALAYAGLRAIVAIAPPDIPRVNDIALDLRVLSVAMLVASAVALAFGLIPLLQARRLDVQDVLKSAGGPQGSAGRERRRLRGALVVAELALAVVLVIGAALLVKSFWRLQQVDAGFRATGVLKAEFSLPAARYPVDFRRWPDFKEMHAFNAAVLETVGALPGVESAAIAGNHPLDPGFTNSFIVVGREAEARSWPEISVRRVTPGYFDTVGLQLARGRLLSEADTTVAPPVVVINRATAERFFRDREPIGARISFWGSARTIVGIVGDEKFHGLGEEAPIAVYAPLAQAPSATGSGVVLVRTRRDPLSLASPVRHAVAQVDPGLALFGIEPLQETVSRSVSRQRFTMLLLGLFAAVALFLAAVGIHGVLSYGVAQRTREIGIRMALGERPQRVVRLIVGEALALTGLGLALGMAGALAARRVLETLLFGVTSTDASTYVAVPVLLVLVALAATYAPARRAVRVDPAVALRAE